MSTTLFAMLMLGAWEVLAILLVLGLGAAIVVVLVVLAIRLGARPPRPQTPAGPPPPQAPSPPTPHLPGTCPRCGSALPPDGAGAGLCPRCLLAIGIGTQPAAPAEPPPTAAEVGQHLPQFEILETIGQGGMGIVFRARQKALDRVVALKVLPRSAADDPAFAERFQREARALARLNHPNIVAVHEFGEAAGYFYLAMEHVDGADLRRVLQQGRLGPAEALRIVPVICDALQYAHANGVVHRDIKPGNILLDREGRVKIADFGIAKLLNVPGGQDITLTQSRQTVGTPHYMAPEQVENPGGVDHRADIYSLGVVFYEMLTGELPLGRFPPPSRRVEVDVRLDDVVLRALEKEPERRYQRADEVKTEVQRIAGTPALQGGAVIQAPPAAPLSASAQRWARTVAFSLSALFPVALFIWSSAERDGLRTAGLPYPVYVLVALAGFAAPFVTTLVGVCLIVSALRQRPPARVAGRDLSAALLFPAVVTLWVIAALFMAWTGSPDARLRATVVAAGLGGVAAVLGARRLHARFNSHPPGAQAFTLAATAPMILLLGVSLVLTTSLLRSLAQRPARPVSLAATIEQAPLPGLDSTTGMLVPQSPWTHGPQGPVLSGAVFTGLLASTTPSQRDALQRALHAAWRDHRSALKENLLVTTNAEGHTVLTVSAFPDRLERIENAFWTAVDSELDPGQRKVVRQLLGTTLRPTQGPDPAFQTHPRPVLMGIGHEDVTCEFWRVGAWYRWQRMAGMTDPAGVQGHHGRDGSELPEDMRMLMDIAGQPPRVEF